MGAFAELTPEVLAQLGNERWMHWGAWIGEPTFAVQDTILMLQAWSLAMLMDPERLTRVADHELKVAKGDASFTLGELFETLSKSVFSELDQAPGAAPGAGGPSKITPQRRNLQRLLLGRWIQFTVNGPQGGPAITRALAFAQLQDVQLRLIQAAGAVAWDTETAAHLIESQVRVRKALEASYQAK
jgi:hypothetical protein